MTDSAGLPLSKNILVSASGGRTSMLMAKLMQESELWAGYNIVNVFANTGKEHEATLRFVDRCDREFGLNIVWVEAEVNPQLGEGTAHKLVTFETASRNGEPFERVIRKYGISNKMFPHCTRELKNRPINSWAKERFGNDYTTAIGFRIDEPRRIKARPGKVYPMIPEWTVKDVREWWNASPFDLELKDYEGNCDLCWKKSIRKKLTILKEQPEVAQWWIDMEKKYSAMDLHDKGAVAYFHQMNESTGSLLERSKQPFVPYTDPFWRQDRNPEMDDEQPCECASSVDYE